MAVIGSGNNLSKIQTIPNNDYNFKVGSQVFLSNGTKNIVPWDVNLPTTAGLDWGDRRQRQIKYTETRSFDYSKRINPAFLFDGYGALGPANNTQNVYWDDDAASGITMRISRLVGNNTGQGSYGIYVQSFKKRSDVAAPFTNNNFQLTGSTTALFYFAVPVTADSTYLYWLVMYGTASNNRTATLVRIVKATGVISVVNSTNLASLGLPTTMHVARVDLSAQKITYFGLSYAYTVSYNTSAFNAPVGAAYPGGVAVAIGNLNLPEITTWADGGQDLIAVNNDNPNKAIYMRGGGQLANQVTANTAQFYNQKVYGLTWVSDSVGYKVQVLDDNYNPGFYPNHLQAQRGNYYTTQPTSQTTQNFPSLHFIDDVTGVCNSPQAAEPPFTDVSYRTTKGTPVTGNHYVEMLGPTKWNQECLVSGYLDGVMYVGANAYKNGFSCPGIDTAAIQNSGQKYGYFATSIKEYGFTLVGSDTDFIYGFTTWGGVNNNNYGGSSITRINKPKTRISRGPVGRVISLIEGAFGGVTLQCTAVPSEGDTITLGSVTYTFKGTIDNNTANQIHIESNPVLQLGSIKQALDACVTEAGTEFSSATVANPLVEAVAQPFNSYNAAANAYYYKMSLKTLNKTNATVPTTETGTGLNFSHTTMQGGINETMTVQFYAGSNLSEGADPDFVYEGQYYDSIDLKGIFDYSHAEIDWTEQNTYQNGLGSTTSNNWQSVYFDGPVVVIDEKLEWYHINSNSFAGRPVVPPNRTYAARGRILLLGRPPSTSYRGLCTYKVGTLV